MRTYLPLVAALFALTLVASATGQDKSGPSGSFTIGQNKLAFAAPEGWTKTKPANNIVEVEFSVPPAKGDDAAGRLTAMGAGGDLEANINRWVSQFAAEGGDAPKPKLDKLSVNSCEVQLVDLSGTYKDTAGGPFGGGKTTLRENYRMLGAIIQTKDAGNYFLKLYGPKATVAANEAKFMELVKSLKVK